MRFGVLGSGSWGTALAKILTDNGQTIHWWYRSETAIKQLMARRHNPHYLSKAYFDTQKLHLTTNPETVIRESDCIVIVIPSAYVAESLLGLDRNIFAGKKIVSAVKGILPEHTQLLNEFLAQEFNLPLEDYFTVLGPCHAEEVAAEKLSYLTFTGLNIEATSEIARAFKTDYLNTLVNNDIYGVQYAAVLKNIYAVGAGMAHGLDYGDNFLSVLIANSADEMASFLREVGIRNLQVGTIDHHTQASGAGAALNDQATNYAASVYLGDLLVTCYSLYSRNRTFGNMIGKGYSVRAAQLEMSMVAEGYNASKCMFQINQHMNVDMPIAETVYRILWEGLSAEEGFAYIEKTLV
jgi:glycerol-3-phosphate dehydrogenase (NAD(P)+)